ncbi:MAG: hypothetical protein AB8G77_00065 [Rhodothermales bacterium]
MKHTVLHRQNLRPAQIHKGNNKGNNADQKSDKTDVGNYFIAVGMRAGDLGYRHVIHEISKLGEVAHFNEGLLYLTTTLSIDQAFKRINKSIIDPRIPSDVGLLIVDAANARAKWYLNCEVSQILADNWHERTNLFVCHDNCANKKLVYDINALGQAIPISEHIWYVSTTYTPKEAYQILCDSKESEDRITIFDATGKVKSWQSERSTIRVNIAQGHAHLPRHASIHQPASWQKSMLAEFL